MEEGSSTGIKPKGQPDRAHLLFSHSTNVIISRLRPLAAGVGVPGQFCKVLFYS